MKTIPAGKRKWITIDRATLYDNQRLGRRLPVIWISIEGDEENRLSASRIDIKGESSVVYGDPRTCGALVWVETTAELEYENT